MPQPASQPAPRTDCATDPACQAETATANVKLPQSRQRTAPAKTCVNRVVTTRRQPVVTTRKLPQFPWADHRLPLVTAPSDELNTRRIRRSCNAICARPLPRAMSAEAHFGAPRALGQGLNPMNRLAAAKRHRCQCRVPRWPERRPRHKSRVVSRVPCSSCNAQALGTDRNTYLTSIHQRQHSDTPGQLTDRRMKNR